MPLSAWDKTRVHGTWYTHNAARIPGTYTVHMPARVTVEAGEAIVPAGVYKTGDLYTEDESRPALDVLVPSNDDPDVTPLGWQIRVDVRLTPPGQASITEKYVIDTPVDGEVNLRAIPLAQTIPATQKMLLRGVPGGVAALDSEGRVVDADGVPVTGGAGGDVDLTGYVKTDELSAALAGKADTGHTHSQYMTEEDLPAAPDLSGLVTSSDLSTALSGKQDAGDYATTQALTSGLSGKADTGAVSGLSSDVAALAGQVADKLDSVSFADVPAGIPVMAYHDGTTWPDRPTDRTDTPVWWIDDHGTHGTPPGFLSPDFLIHPGTVDAPPAGPEPLAVYDFEDQTNGQPITGTGEWSIQSGASTVTASTQAAIHGQLGGRITSASSLCYVEYAAPEATSTDRVIDFYLRPDNIPGNSYIAVIRHFAESTTRADLRINTAGTLTARNENTAVATSTTVLTPGTVYRVAWRVGATGQEIRIYQGDSPEPLETLTGPLTDTTHDRIRVGLTAASAGVSLDFDTVRIADDWLTPAGA